MQALEKILEEVSRLIEKHKNNAFELVEKEPLTQCYTETDIEQTKVHELAVVRDIIRKHMNDGWIPMEKFGLPKSNEHDFMFWITIQYVNGFRRTIKAKWDWFDKCFIHQNGKKILQDVIAYKYYSAPEPYRPERSDNHDGE